MKIKEKIKINDNILPYPEEQNTGAKLKDGAFNWIVSRYKKFNHPWKKSDNIVWKGAIYSLSWLFGIIIFLAIMWVLINFSIKKYGEMRTLFYILLLVLLRVNAMIKQLIILNKKL